MVSGATPRPFPRRRTSEEVRWRVASVRREGGDSVTWHRLMISTVGLEGGAMFSQPYDHSAACVMCGAGAVPIEPLVVRLGRMRRRRLDRPVHDGQVVVDQELAAALAKAGLSGFELRACASPRGGSLGAGFMWLRPTREWPPMLEGSSVVTDDLCPTCGRTGYFDAPRCPSRWRYRLPPDGDPDFGVTWERFGYWRGKQWRRDLR